MQLPTSNLVLFSKQDPTYPRMPSPTSLSTALWEMETHTHAMASSEALLLPIAELSVQSSVDVTAPEGEIVVGTE
jgi:hypothetical protein